MATRPAQEAPAALWANHIIRHGSADPHTLVPNPQNWRKHPALQREGTASSLRRLGWLKEVIYNERTGRLVDGHLRVALALEFDQPDVPVTYIDISEADEALALLLLDPLAGLAGADAALLQQVMQRAQTSDLALQKIIEAVAVEFKVVPPPPGLPMPPPSLLDTDEDDDFVETGAHQAPPSNIHLVQLFLTADDYPAFKAAVDALGEQYQSETMTDTVVACVRQAAAALEG